MKLSFLAWMRDAVVRALCACRARPAQDLGPDTPPLFAALRAREYRFDSFQLVQVPDQHPLAGVGARRLASLLQGGWWAGIKDTDPVVLIDFRRDLPGLVTRPIAAIHHVPLHFTDIVAYQPLSEDQLAQRLDFARATGYLPVNRGEVLAVEWADSGSCGFSLGEVYELSRDGVRQVHGLGHSRLKPRAVADLDRTETQDSIGTTQADLVYARAAGHHWRAGMLERALERLQEHLLVARPERTECGAVVERLTFPDGDVTQVSHLLPSRDGWREYPTGEGTWYYGVFVNPKTLQTATFAEGDFVVITCESGAQFRQELHSLATFHSPRRAPMAVGHGEDSTVAYFDSLTFFPNGGVPVRFDTGEPAKDANGRWVPPLHGFLNLELACLRMKDGESLPLSPEAFHLDLLDLREFGHYQATATKTARGYTVTLQLASRILHGAVVSWEDAVA